MESHDWDTWENNDYPHDSADPAPDDYFPDHPVDHQVPGAGDDTTDPLGDDLSGTDIPPDEHHHPADLASEHDGPPEEPLALDDLPDDPADPTPADHPDPDHADHPDPDHLHQLVGADPDLTTHADDPAWTDNTFPEPVDVGHPPEPVDGFPWSDPTLLGEPVNPIQDSPTWPSPAAADLAAYAGVDSTPDDPWAALLASDDPATGNLARWWTTE